MYCSATAAKTGSVDSVKILRTPCIAWRLCEWTSSYSTTPVSGLGKALPFQRKGSVSSSSANLSQRRRKYATVHDHLRHVDCEAIIEKRRGSVLRTWDSMVMVVAMEINSCFGDASDEKSSAALSLRFKVKGKWPVVPAL